MRQGIALGVLTLGMALSSGAAWLVGQTPTDFTCTDWNGGSWNLYQQRGKVVVINFGATW